MKRQTKKGPNEDGPILDSVRKVLCEEGAQELDKEGTQHLTTHVFILALSLVPNKCFFLFDCSTDICNSIASMVT